MSSALQKVRVSQKATAMKGFSKILLFIFSLSLLTSSCGPSRNEMLMQNLSYGLNNSFKKDFRKKDINYESATGNTYLLEAVRKANFEMVKFLLEAGADPLRKTSQGYAAADIAIASANYKVHKLGLKWAPIRLRNSDQSWLDERVRHMVLYSSPKVLQNLLQNGGNAKQTVENAHGDRRTLLHNAAANASFRDPTNKEEYRNKEKVVSLLIKFGARVNATEENTQRTPLFYAARGRVVATLIKAGAKIKVKDADGAGPMSVLAAAGNISSVQALLTRGIKPPRILLIPRRIVKERTEVFRKYPQYGQAPNKLLYRPSYTVEKTVKYYETNLVPICDVMFRFSNKKFCQQLKKAGYKLPAKPK